jgi:ABC-type phosphate/phosphonate transport system substrate-binding protein
MADKTLVMGAVAYAPKVVTIWDGFKEYFAGHGLAFDYVLFSNYERQVQALFDGGIDVAWNSPLAIAMRDTDCDLTSVIVVRSDADIKTVADLKGKRVGVGAIDSPQATLIPLNFLRGQGLKPGSDFTVRRFDVLGGKHGDHIGGERDAARALMAGELDAACMIDGNHLLFVGEGTLPAGRSRVLAQTPAYDHCNFTVTARAPGEQIEQLHRLLMSMSYADAAVRPLLDLEGLKAWQQGRTSGYALLEQAVDAAHFYDAQGAIVEPEYRY